MRLVDDIVTVREESIVQAMRQIWEVMKLIVEPSGAVPLCGGCRGPSIAAASGASIGIILSGGNLDLNRLPWQCTRVPWDSVEQQRAQGMLFGDAAGERQRLRARRRIAHPACRRRQRLVGEQREQAGVGDFDGIERRAVTRAAHHHQLGVELFAPVRAFPPAA